MMRAGAERNAWMSRSAIRTARLSPRATAWCSNAERATQAFPMERPGAAGCVCSGSIWRDQRYRLEAVAAQSGLTFLRHHESSEA
jgi:hypothetical protein